MYSHFIICINSISLIIKVMIILIEAGFMFL